MKRRAFTIIESVMGFSLLALGLVGVVGVLNTSLMLSSTNQHAVQSELILQELLEFYSQDYVYWRDAQYDLDPVRGVDGVQFTRAVRFSTYSADPLAPVRRVEVVSRWVWKHQNYERTRARLLCRPGR